ncbi:hypothetical protein ACJW30_05G076200 [Castanea mollissima]
MSIFNSLKAYLYGGILKTRKKKKEENHIMKNRRKRRNNGTNEKRRTIPFNWPSFGEGSRPAQIKNPFSQNVVWRKGASPIRDCGKKKKNPKSLITPILSNNINTQK